MDALQEAVYCSDSGNEKLERLIENAGAADIVLRADEVLAIDNALDNMEMSEVYGGTRVIK